MNQYLSKKEKKRFFLRWEKEGPFVPGPYRQWKQKKKKTFISRGGREKRESPVTVSNSREQWREGCSFL